MTWCLCVSSIFSVRRFEFFELDGKKKGYVCVCVWKLNVRSSIHWDLLRFHATTVKMFLLLSFRISIGIVNRFRHFGWLAWLSWECLFESLSLFSALPHSRTLGLSVLSVCVQSRHRILLLGKTTRMNNILIPKSDADFILVFGFGLMDSLFWLCFSFVLFICFVSLYALYSESCAIFCALPSISIFQVAFSYIYRCYGFILARALFWTCKFIIINLPFSYCLFVVAAVVRY